MKEWAGRASNKVSYNRCSNSSKIKYLYSFSITGFCWLLSGMPLKIFNFKSQFTRIYGKENIQRYCLQERRREIYLTIQQFLPPLFSSFNSFNFENHLQTYGKTIFILDSEFYLLFYTLQ